MNYSYYKESDRLVNTSWSASTKKKANGLLTTKSLHYLIWLPSSAIIIKLIENYEYIATIREKLTEIRHFSFVLAKN